MAHTEIELRRTKLDINTTDTETKAKINKEKLLFGEALYGDTNKYLLIGDGSTDNTELPRIKLVGKNIVEKQIYVSGSDNLKTLDNTDVKPATDAAKVTYEKFGSNVKGALDALDIRTQNISDGYFYATAIEKNGAANKVVSNPESSKTIFVTGVEGSNQELKYNTNVKIDCEKGILKGAAWNDFAEFRTCPYGKPGLCVVENGDGSLSPAVKRMQAGAAIVSDTFGMVIGDEKESSKPIGVAGRVLAYAYGRDELKAGDAVCSDKDGRVSKMSRFEMIFHPECIVGYVSEIPDYALWNDVEVHGRVWIKIK